MANTCGINIVSDFIDYYDCCQNKDANVIYYRNYSREDGKASELKELREAGIETIKLGQASTLISESDKLVIYTQPKLHGGDGKIVVNMSDAMMLYENCLASPYYKQPSNVYYKMLQIGKRKFQCEMELVGGINKSICKSVIEIQSGYNYRLKYPIYSIDYIDVNRVMTACDFNKVEYLYWLGIQNFITPDEICKEVREALTFFDKRDIMHK